MSKKTKTGVKVFYYVVMIGFTIMLALTLPSGFAYDETMKYVKGSLTKGNYEAAASVVGGFYDDQHSYFETFESGGGIVLYNAATLQYTDADGKSQNKITKSYSGFIWGVRDTYQTDGNTGNKSKILIVDKLGENHYIPIIDYDTDNDDIKDCCVSLKKHDFLYVDFSTQVTPSIDVLKFLDKDEQTFLELDVDFDFTGGFFDDVEPFITEYNINPSSSELKNLSEAFKAKSEHYKECVSGPGQQRAITISVIIIACFVLLTYFIGDSLLGKRYIIHFFKWILVKVFKVKFKSDETKRAEQLKKEVFGTDYNCSLTFELDVSEVPEMEDVVVIKYSNEKESFEFNLIKTENYKQTKSAKAGIYVNPWFEINENYVFGNIPETLDVEGFKKELTIKITRKESEEKQ